MLDWLYKTHYLTLFGFRLELRITTLTQINGLAAFYELVARKKFNEADEFLRSLAIKCDDPEYTRATIILLRERIITQVRAREVEDQAVN